MVYVIGKSFLIILLSTLVSLVTGGDALSCPSASYKVRLVKVECKREMADVRDKCINAYVDVKGTGSFLLDNGAIMAHWFGEITSGINIKSLRIEQSGKLIVALYETMDSGSAGHIDYVYKVFKEGKAKPIISGGIQTFGRPEYGLTGEIKVDKLSPDYVVFNICNTKYKYSSKEEPGCRKEHDRENIKSYVCSNELQKLVAFKVDETGNVRLIRGWLNYMMQPNESASDVMEVLKLPQLRFKKKGAVVEILLTDAQRSSIFAPVQQSWSLWDIQGLTYHPD